MGFCIVTVKVLNGYESNKKSPICPMWCEATEQTGDFFIKPKFYRESQKSILLLSFCFSKVKSKDNHVDSLH